MLHIFSPLHTLEGISFLRQISDTSLVVQWLRILLAMQGPWDRATKPTCCIATREPPRQVNKNFLVIQGRSRAQQLRLDTAK